MNFLEEVWAVALRDLKLRSTFIKYIGTILLVGVSILLIGAGFDTFIDFSAYGSSYTEFFAGGMLVFYIISAGLSIGVETITDRKGFIRVLLAAPISRYSLLFGKILSGFIGSLQFFAVMFLIFLIATGNFTILRVFAIIGIMLFMIISWCGFGLWCGSLFKNRDVAQQVIGMSSFVILFISGVFYPIQAMPAFVKWIFYANPASYAVDLFRFIASGQNYFPLWLSVSVCLVFGIASFILGTWLFDRKQRK